MGLAEGDTVSVNQIWRQRLFVAALFVCSTEANAEGLAFLVAVLYRQLNVLSRLQDFENVFVY